MRTPLPGARRKVLPGPLHKAQGEWEVAQPEAKRGVWPRRSPLSWNFWLSGKWTEEQPGGERTGGFARPGEEGPVQEEGGTGKLTESWGLQPQIPGASVAPLSLPRVRGATGQGRVWPEELSLARPGHGVRAHPLGG